MPRPKIARRMINPPKIKGFTPYGDTIIESGPVFLFLEEYETIRLCDYELKTQAEAAAIMQVSRPTITRIYESARRKIALALTEGKTIVIEGGKVVIDGAWNHCLECESIFNKPANMSEAGKCPVCGSDNIENLGESFDVNNQASEYSTNNNSDLQLCVCPACGYEKYIKVSKNCCKEKCNHCGEFMSIVTPASHQPEK